MGETVKHGEEGFTAVTTFILAACDSPSRSGSKKKKNTSLVPAQGHKSHCLIQSENRDPTVFLGGKLLIGLKGYQSGH